MLSLKPRSRQSIGPAPKLAKVRGGRMTLYNIIERDVERGKREAPNDYLDAASLQAFKDVIGDLKRRLNPRAQQAAAKVYVESFRDIWWINDVVLKL
jgi:hypothetical protein